MHRDNSTRGLDSANAVEFCKTLRTQCDIFGSSTFVAIYQAPQAAYDVRYVHILSIGSVTNTFIAIRQGHCSV
jgi:ABC-type multidrug transport system ATPase subunit